MKINSKQYTVVRKILILGLIALSLSTIYYLLSTSAYAQTDYKLLAPLPYGANNTIVETTTTAGYLPGLFRLILALATGAAVLRLMFAGIMYMSTDAFSGKEEAKGMIEETLWGLLLAISAWVILNTINPDLVNLRLDVSPVTINFNNYDATTPTSGTVGGRSTLTTPQVIALLKAGQVDVGPYNFAGLRQSTIDEAIRLRAQCGCKVVVTSGTGGRHAEGVMSHATGHKIDVRSRNDGQPLTDFILNRANGYVENPPRSNGDRIFTAPSGAIYVWETNKPNNAPPGWAPHWDIVVRG